jgi:hypothetical protein
MLDAGAFAPLDVLTVNEVRLARMKFPSGGAARVPWLHILVAQDVIV